MTTLPSTWDTNSKVHVLHRDNNTAIKFVGQLIANVTSRNDDSSRWTEIRIYSVEHNPTWNYMCEIVGGTNVPDEVPRRKALPASCGDEVRERLRRTPPDGTAYITRLAMRALEEAAFVDAGIANALVEEL